MVPVTTNQEWFKHQTFWIRPLLPERVKNSPLGKRLFVVDAGVLLVHQVLDLYHV